MSESARKQTTVDPEEIARFAALAEAWWDPDGDRGPLHRMNPARLSFIRDRLCGHFGLPQQRMRPLGGLAVLDVGCGGGLLSEPLARMGARVTGIDATEALVGAAQAHAFAEGLDIDYRTATAEEVEGSFDAVIALEVIEHVADADAFIAACVRLVRPGGALILSTLNRTPKAYLFAIVGGEYVLRWLPAGTHDFRKFVRPSELAAHLRAHGIAITELAGLSYNPLDGGWRLSRDVSVNYLAFAPK
jgi:2-polyprenyl-6-hydroxyphenyl methylase/3-demethylubiquinone-9 3-methyltransferase